MRTSTLSRIRVGFVPMVLSLVVCNSAVLIT